MFTLAKKKTTFRISTLAVLLIAGFGLSACNTVDGAGQDVSAAGNAVSDAARDVQDEL
ncbi:MAG: entericidin A/B family lipoprotein [Pseudomonadota bacterium]